MKKTALLVLALWLCATMASAKEITFAHSYDEAVKMAGEKDTKILIKFYTEW